MSGYTKHMYENDMQEVKKEFEKYISDILQLLPAEYEENQLMELLVRYYPFEWQMLKEKYNAYCKTDEKLSRFNKKPRYSMPKPEEFILDLPIYKRISQTRYKTEYKRKFNADEQIKYKEVFEKKRIPKIEKRMEKVGKAKLKAQEVEPQFLDVLMGLYDRKNTSQKDKVYIMKELQKYYCSKVINFFKRKAHSEYNRQLRCMAFYHLQELGHYSVLRKQKYMQMHTKNKKNREKQKIYAFEEFNIKNIPEELEYRISNSKEQKIKGFDYFISHSSQDYDKIQKLIQKLNKQKRNVYCDWINDTDYLKRKLVGTSTLEEIKKRIQQSTALIWVRSDASLRSNWVKYELNYAQRLGKEIYYIDANEIDNEMLKYFKLDEFWFEDEDFENIELFS